MVTPQAQVSPRTAMPMISDAKAPSVTTIRSVRIVNRGSNIELDTLMTDSVDVRSETVSEREIRRL